MKTTFPPLPVSDEVFRTIIRMHEQRRTYAEIGTAVGMSAQEVEDLRWKHLDRWLKERATIGAAVRSEMLMTIVAHLQLVMLTTENPKELALLSKALDGIIKHDPLRQKADLTPPAPLAEAARGEPDKESPAAESLADAPCSASEKGEKGIALAGMRSADPVALTPVELAQLQTLRDQSPTNTELLYKMQQAPTLYDKCLKLGSLPQIENPEPPPTPPAKRSWASKLFAGLVYALVATTVFLGSSRLRTALDEPVRPAARVQAHPPNH